MGISEHIRNVWNSGGKGKMMLVVFALLLIFTPINCVQFGVYMERRLHEDVSDDEFEVVDRTEKIYGTILIVSFLLIGILGFFICKNQNGSIESKFGASARYGIKGTPLRGLNPRRDLEFHHQL